MANIEVLTGSRRALEQRLADEVVAARARDPLAPLPVLVGGTLLRPHLRRRIVEITGGHLNASRAPARPHRPSRSAASGHRPGHGGLLPARRSHRGGRFADVGPLGARAHQRDPRSGAQRAGRGLRRDHPLAIAWYRQHGYGTGKFGDANNIANARNTSVESMARGGVLTSAAGKVTLLAPAALPEEYDPALDEQISAWEVLHHMVAGLEREGLGRAGELLAAAGARNDAPVDADLVKELAFLLFALAEKNSWTKDALAFNTLATSWPEIVDAAREGATRQTP
jgi:hypothetical protein